MPQHPFLISLGGLAGALLRWGIIETSDTHTSWIVLALNIVGSLLIGWLVGRGLTSPSAWALGALGFCGGLTTFSTFALDVASRLNGGQFVNGAGLMLTTAGLAVLAASVGYRIGRWEIPPLSDHP